MPSFPLRFFFRLITLAVMCALTLPVLVQDGMFMDAMLYTSVSHNLAQGIGTFWFPQFSASLMAGLPSFHEQPPLVFGIQSLFFKALGSGMFVERVYAFITMLLTASLIVWLWRRVQRDAALQKMEWLPVLLWITIPVCFWSFQNNMHENTMGLFVLLSAIAFYRSFQLDNTKIQLVLFSVLAGVFVFLATFSKGIPGLFPLAAPALYWLATRRISFRRAFVKTALAVATVASIYGVLLAFPDSRQSLQYHFVDRALHRINQDPTVDYRLYIIVRLVQELAVPIALSIVCYLVSYRKRSTAVTPPARLTIFFLLLGFAGSAPLLLTMVQKGFYFVPSLPFFAIGFAVWIAPVLMRWIDARKFSAATIGMLNGAAVALLVGVFVVSYFNIGKTSRDHDILSDVRVIEETVPSHSVVGINPAGWNNWELQCYLMRYHNVSIVPNHMDRFFLREKTSQEPVPPGFRRVGVETQRYDLFLLP